MFDFLKLKRRYFVSFTYKSIDKESFIYKGRANTVITFNGKIKTKKDLVILTNLVKQDYLKVSKYADSMCTIINIQKL